MKYVLPFLAIIAYAKSSNQDCEQKAGLTECVDTPITKATIENLASTTVVLSMKHAPRNTVIHSGTFRTLPNLEKLYLSFANIKTLQPNAFQNLANLLELHLTNNDLEEVPTGVFDTCRRLRILDLNLNKIRTISSDAFNEIVELEELDLSSNLLEQVPNLRALVSLKKLNLGYNKLTVINSGDFASLGRLTTLKLNDNRLTSLHSNALRGLRNLRELDVRSNHITSLDVRSIFQISSRLHEISISLNDFSCAALRSILSEFEERNVKVTEGASRATNAINGISCKA